jgi:hypothetical protein
MKWKIKSPANFNETNVIDKSVWKLYHLNNLSNEAHLNENE